jgi:hypothetical protein
MSTPANDAFDESKIDRTKNSASNLAYYEDLVAAFEGDATSTLLKLRSFALYTPRQVITDYLVRYELFKLVADIPGSIFEFGVFNGQGLLSWAMFSTITEPNAITRKVYGFDTFAGFTELEESDKKSRSSFMAEGDYAIGSQKRVEKAIELFDRNRFIGHVPKVELVPGDVTETLPRFLEENPHAIASLIYLDVDIYRPTKVALELMLDRMPRGAIVAFDELNLKDAPGETAALLDTLDINTVALKKIPFCSRISYFRIGD